MVTAQGRDSVEVEFVVPPQVRVGDPMALVLRVRNGGAQPLDLYLRGRTPTLDVIVSRPNGDTVWRRLEGEVIPAILGIRTLSPGGQLEVEARWDQRTQAGTAAAPGDYLAQGFLLTDGAPLDAGPVPFRVVAR